MIVYGGLHNKGQHGVVLLHRLRRILLGSFIDILLDLSGQDCIYGHLAEIENQVELDRG